MGLVIDTSAVIQLERKQLALPTALANEPVILPDFTKPSVRIVIAARTATQSGPLRIWRSGKGSSFRDRVDQERVRVERAEGRLGWAWLGKRVNLWD